ncbi:hypothetical protein CLF_106140 [Clonorchis sinensis]|uniref:Uncharacterized protein n=1 Tax=Clonorchis sinensis TaxID=79923 RepID=G7YPQ0_CLOSI|nr:hypothetical protein CLF_106140 [Clonorchis sinensis]
MHIADGLYTDNAKSNQSYGIDFRRHWRDLAIGYVAVDLFAAFVGLEDLDSFCVLLCHIHVYATKQAERSINDLSSMNTIKETNLMEYINPAVVMKPCCHRSVHSIFNTFFHTL